MIKNITGSLIVANEVVFNDIEKYHSVVKVLNQVDVPTLPAAIATEILVKLLIPFEKVDFYSDLEPEIHVINESGKLITNTFFPFIANMRRPKSIPGIDMYGIIRFPVVEEGVYEYQLLVGNEHLTSYYISVYSTENH